MDVKEKFFPIGSPLGRILKVRGVPVQVVGVEEKRGSFMGDSQDRHLYLPITLHNQIFTRTGGLSVHGKSADKETFQASIDEAQLLLRNKRQLDRQRGRNISAS